MNEGVGDMKMNYINAEMEIVLFEKEDVIATSGPITSSPTSNGLINGGIGSGDSGKFDDLFPGL